MKKYMLFIIPVYLVYVFGYFYVVLPPLNWHAPEFWQFLIFTVGPILVITLIFSLTNQGMHAFDRLKGKFMKQTVHDATAKTSNWKTAAKLSAIALAIMIIFLLRHP